MSLGSTVAVDKSAVSLTTLSHSELCSVLPESPFLQRKGIYSQMLTVLSADSPWLSPFPQIALN